MVSLSQEALEGIKPVIVVQTYPHKTNYTGGYVKPVALLFFRCSKSVEHVVYRILVGSGYVIQTKKNIPFVQCQHVYKKRELSRVSKWTLLWQRLITFDNPNLDLAEANNLEVKELLESLQLPCKIFCGCKRLNVLFSSLEAGFFILKFFN